MTTCSVSIAAHYLRNLAQMPVNQQDLRINPQASQQYYCLMRQAVHAVHGSLATVQSKDIAQDKKVRLYFARAGAKAMHAEASGNTIHIRL